MKLYKPIGALWLMVSFLFVGACGSHSHDHDDHDHDHDHDKDHDEEMIDDRGIDSHEHEGAVVIDGETAERFGIETMELEPGNFYEVIRTSGRIEPSPTDVVTAGALKSGIFTLSHGISEGSEVKAGQTLGIISTAGLQGGDKNAAARANRDAAKRELDRITPLYKEGLVTASAYNEARRAYEEAAALSGASAGGSAAVTSPISGTVTALPAPSGSYVEAGQPVAVVTKNSRLTLRADVPERYASVLPLVADADFRPEYSDSAFSVSALGGARISNGSNPQGNGFISVYFSFDSNGAVIPGAFAEVYLKGQPRENVMTLPGEALVEMQGNRYAYVVEDGHAFEKRLVQTGASDGKSIEILSGIEPGETVVSKGATIVRMIETSAVAPPSHSHNH